VSQIDRVDEACSVPALVLAEALLVVEPQLLGDPTATALKAMVADCPERTEKGPIAIKLALSVHETPAAEHAWPLKEMDVPAPLRLLGKESVSPVTDRSLPPAGLFTVSVIERAIPTAYVAPPGLTLSVRVGGLALNVRMPLTSVCGALEVTVGDPGVARLLERGVAGVDGVGSAGGGGLVDGDAAVLGAVVV